MRRRLVTVVILGVCCIGMAGASQTPLPAATGVYDGSLPDADTAFPLPIIPPGACILPDGSCVVTLDTICRYLDGEFQGANTECPDSQPAADGDRAFPLPIVPPGACILPDGECVVTLDTICRRLNGQFQGAYTECP